MPSPTASDPVVPVALGRPSDAQFTREERGIQSGARSLALRPAGNVSRNACPEVWSSGGQGLGHQGRGLGGGGSGAELRAGVRTGEGAWHLPGCGGMSDLTAAHAGAEGWERPGQQCLPVGNLLQVREAQQLFLA